MARGRPGGANATGLMQPGSCNRAHARGPPPRTKNRTPTIGATANSPSANRLCLARSATEAKVLENQPPTWSGPDELLDILLTRLEAGENGLDECPFQHTKLLGELG